MKKIHTECLGEWFHMYTYIYIFIPFWRSFMLPSHSPNDGPFGLPSVSQERDWIANTSCRDFRMENHLLVGCNGFKTWKLNPCSGYLAIWKKYGVYWYLLPNLCSGTTWHYHVISGHVAMYLQRGMWHSISSWLSKHTELTNPNIGQVSRNSRYSCCLNPLPIQKKVASH